MGQRAEQRAGENRPPGQDRKATDEQRRNEQARLADRDHQHDDRREQHHGQQLTGVGAFCACKRHHEKAHDARHLPKRRRRRVGPCAEHCQQRQNVRRVGEIQKSMRLGKEGLRCGVVGVEMIGIDAVDVGHPTRDCQMTSCPKIYEILAD